MNETNDFITVEDKVAERKRKQAIASRKHYLAHKDAVEAYRLAWKRKKYAEDMEYRQKKLLQNKNWADRQKDLGKVIKVVLD
jgi:hypothetical protein